MQVIRMHLEDLGRILETAAGRGDGVENALYRKSYYLDENENAKTDLCDSSVWKRWVS